MADPCFWSQVLNLDQECGDPGPQEPVEVSFHNGYLKVDEWFQLAYQEGFIIGPDFTLEVEGDGQYLLRYLSDQERYSPWADDHESYYSGPSDVAGVVTQGSGQWPVRVFSFWT